MHLPPNPKAVLIDLAGVLHVGDEAIAGAIPALRALRATGRGLRFLTNTTRTPRSTLVQRLRAIGFEIEDDEVLTAPMAARDYVRSHGLAPHWLVHPDIAPDLGASSPNPTAVVMGDAGPYFTFEAMNTAFRLLASGLPLIAMARNRYFRETDGLTLDMGAYVAGLEFAAGVTATVVGKPAQAYFEAALSSLGVAPHEAVMIGDDVTDDIGGAQAAGIAGILVRTGKFRPQDEHHDVITPAAVEDDFAAAIIPFL
ncbi:TIGR01458 family HAD-type hydrolase [Uliginosibacterium sp. sgz301328]|uniref:TIGR01458 family HAD-type hydrolase n=1 Tax=Uliginosibacterium sp. sgz301328 TaxID=3243764 RepID=UPI00359EA820